jgi:hypothetical protein
VARWKTRGEFRGRKRIAGAHKRARACGCFSSRQPTDRENAQTRKLGVFAARGGNEITVSKLIKSDREPRLKCRTNWVDRLAARTSMWKAMLDTVGQGKHRMASTCCATERRRQGRASTDLRRRAGFAILQGAA